MHGLLIIPPRPRSRSRSGIGGDTPTPTPTPTPITMIHISPSPSGDADEGSNPSPDPSTGDLLSTNGANGGSPSPAGLDPRGLPGMKGSNLQKDSKESCLFIDRPGSAYTCQECVLYAPDSQSCQIIPSTQIQPDWGCNYWTDGTLTPEEAGLSPSPFSCGNCRNHLDPADCQCVDKDTPGSPSAQGSIPETACCSHFYPV